jgi:hypothetical protein
MDTLEHLVNSGSAVYSVNMPLRLIFRLKRFCQRYGIKQRDFVAKALESAIAIYEQEKLSSENMADALSESGKIAVEMNARIVADRKRARIEKLLRGL